MFDDGAGVVRREGGLLGGGLCAPVVGVDERLRANSIKVSIKIPIFNLAPFVKRNIVSLMERSSDYWESH